MRKCYVKAWYVQETKWLLKSRTSYQLSAISDQLRTGGSILYAES
jgi:hypothetical protein